MRTLTKLDQPLGLSDGKSAKKGVAGHAHAHESAVKHVTGTADYTDDLMEPVGTLHGYLGLSPVAHGRITAMDLDAVKKAPGVHAVLTAEDIPGHNDISPTGLHDEPVFATPEVQFVGQPIFAVIAETRDQARRACKLAQIEYDALPFATDVLAARDAGMGYVTAPLKLARGDMAAMAAAPRGDGRRACPRPPPARARSATSASGRRRSR